MPAATPLTGPPSPRGQGMSPGLLVGLFAALMGVLLACSAGSEPGPSTSSTSSSTSAAPSPDVETPVSTEPDIGGELRAAVAEIPEILVPIAGGCDAGCRSLRRALFDSLLERDRQGRLVGELAAGFEVDDTATRWTVELRPGVVFHDGSPLDGATLAALVERQRGPSSALAAELAHLSELEVDGDRVTYVLERPDAAFGDRLTRELGLVVHPDSIPEQLDQAPPTPVGTGPFRLSDSQPDRLELTNFEEHWRTPVAGVPRPRLERLVLVAVAGEQERRDALADGQVELIFSSSPALIAAARQNSALTTLVAPSENASAVIFNLARPPTDDIRVRRSLAAAIDVPAAVATVGDPTVQPVEAPWYSSASLWHSPDAAAAALSAAADELSDYRNDPDRSDGAAAGAPVVVELVCPQGGRLDGLAEAYAAAITDAGFEVELTLVPATEHVTRVVGRESLVGEFGAACWRLGDDLDPDLVLFDQFADPSQAAANVTGLDSAELRELLTRARSEADQERRVELYDQAQLILAERVVAAWSARRIDAVIATPAVGGLERPTLAHGGPARVLEHGELRWHDLWVGSAG